MDGSSGFGEAGSSSWRSFTHSVVGAYVCDYAGSIQARCFQAMSTHGDCRSVYDPRHGVNGYTWVGA